MERRDIVIGVVILLVLAAIVYWVAKPQAPKLEEPTPTPSLEEQIESRFNRDIPEGAQKAELKDVSGGTGSGLVVTEDVEGAKKISILVDLPDPAAGETYQAWLEKEDRSVLMLGSLRTAKGGFLLDLQTKQKLEDYKKIVISLEKTRDSKIETRVLETSLTDIK